MRMSLIASCCSLTRLYWRGWYRCTCCSLLFFLLIYLYLSWFLSCFVSLSLLLSLFVSLFFLSHSLFSLPQPPISLYVSLSLTLFHTFSQLLCINSLLQFFWPRSCQEIDVCPSLSCRCLPDNSSVVWGSATLLRHQWEVDVLSFSLFSPFFVVRTRTLTSLFLSLSLSVSLAPTQHIFTFSRSFSLSFSLCLSYSYSIHIHILSLILFCTLSLSLTKQPPRYGEDWDDYSPLQLAGFLVITLGVFLYYNVIQCQCLFGVEQEEGYGQSTSSRGDGKGKGELHSRSGYQRPRVRNVDEGAHAHPSK